MDNELLKKYISGISKDVNEYKNIDMSVLGFMNIDEVFNKNLELINSKKGKIKNKKNEKDEGKILPAYEKIKLRLQEIFPDRKEKITVELVKKYINICREKRGLTESKKVKNIYTPSNSGESIPQNSDKKIVEKNRSHQALHDDNLSYQEKATQSPGKSFFTSGNEFLNEDEAKFFNNDYYQSVLFDYKQFLFKLD